MGKKVIAVQNAPQAIGPYSQAVVCGNTIYVSGQLPIDPVTGGMGEDIKKQTALSLKNIEAILCAEQLSLDDVVKTTVFMKDLSQFTAMNEVYQQYIKSPFPARSTIEVAGLPKNALVEIECVAVKKN